MLNEAISKMPEAFESKVLLRGLEYFQQGQVLNIRLSDGLLKGRVKGSSSQIYDIYMDLKTWPGKSANCTCPYQLNCKHAAACLFALRDREQNSNESRPVDRLDRKLDIWLKNLRAQEDTAVSKHEPTHHLVYLIELKLSGHEHKASIKLALAKILKRGGYGKKIPFNTLSESKKQHFVDDDNDIVAQLLFKCGASGWFGDLPIRNSELLERVLSTGRAFFEVNDTAPIQLGETLNGTCQWILSPNGSQHLELMDDAKSIDPLLLDAPWYYDYSYSLLGRFTTPYPVKQLRHLLEAPAIPLDQAELLSKKMAVSCPEFPSPQVFKQRKKVELTPTAVLILDAVNHSDEDAWFEDDFDSMGTTYTARVAFDYSGLMIFDFEEGDTVVQQQGDLLVEYVRDLDFENLKIEELNKEFELRPTQPWEHYHWNLTENATYVLENISKSNDVDYLLSTTIPKLQTQGWRVEYASPAYQQVVHADELEWFSELQEGSTDFFSYQLGILVEGKPVSIVPLVAELIQNYKGTELDKLEDTQLVKLPLDEGRALQVELGRIKPLVRLLLQFGARHINEEQQLQINKYQLILLQEAELAIVATKARWQGAEH